MKTTIKYITTIIFLFAIFINSSCTDENKETGGASIEGIWVRNIGASGDKTDLAIGGIAGEAQNRVYMCEKNGSGASLYKGSLEGNTITWDVNYGLPDTYLRRVGFELEFSYPSISSSIPTRYGKGTWSGECGLLQNDGGSGGGGGGTTTGQAMFWIASDLGVGAITVTCNGSSKTFNSYYSSGAPSCGATGAANFTLNPGTYSYSASAGTSKWSGTITVTAGGCSKLQLTGSGGGGGGGTTTGQAMFWTASDLGVGAITVTCNGSSKTFNSYYSSGAPSCGASGAANFTLNPGTYSYSASAGTSKWSGTITVTAGGCSKLQLTGSGGGGGGGTTTGQAMFWTASDLGVGAITVTCNGSSKTFNSYYSSGAPSCGASGAANFTLNPGTYSYSASAGTSKWSGTITVTAGGCSKLQLTGSGGGGGGGTTTGQAMFWTASDLGVGAITVTCNGSSKTFNSYYSSGAPSCGATGAANFTLNPGTYSYSASAGTSKWSGTITVTAGGCSKLQLTGSGGGGGGGTTTGQAMFWTASDLGVGAITVTCNGSSKTFNSYYSSGAPSCGATGAANFTLNPGTYSYSASAGTTRWSGTITVSSGGCSTVKFTK